MKESKRTLLKGAIGVALAAALLAGCNKPADPVTQAAKQDAAAGAPVPGIAEVKAIAEEGFIYGLPIVMNYAVMVEYIVDKNSGQWKAPFNTIHNEARVFTWGRPPWYSSSRRAVPGSTACSSTTSGRCPATSRAGATTTFSCSPS